MGGEINLTLKGEGRRAEGGRRDEFNSQGGRKGDGKRDKVYSQGEREAQGKVKRKNKQYMGRVGWKESQV